MLLLEGTVFTFETWRELFKIIKKIEDAQSNAKNLGQYDKADNLKIEFDNAKDTKFEFEKSLLNNIDEFISKYKDMKIVESINKLLKEQNQKVNS